MKRELSLSVAASLLLAALTASATPRYVNLNNPVPVAPYTNWLSAATNIQHAVDAAVDGDEIVVTNGLYATGGRAVYGTMTNRVAIDKAVTVRSVNGPLVTIIEGRAVPGGYLGCGDGAIRCVYVGAGALLSGFTLTNGHTRTIDDDYKQNSGGGAWCEFSGVVTNCTFSGNSAVYGGGVFDGTLNTCTLTGNSASAGGGASYGTLSNCTLTGNSANAGGGALYGTLSNCTLTGNSAFGEGGGAVEGTLNNCTLSGNSADYGGGAAHSRLNNCILMGNSAHYQGGGAYQASLNNCTLTGNSAVEGGGVCDSWLNNCIVYYNTYENYNWNTTLNYCCTTPESGTACVSNPPLFVDTNRWSNLRLQAGSPCIDAGDNAYATDPIDLDGKPRIVGDTVDIGAYEFQVHYVAPASANPTPPYYSWATAATSIQDAIDVAAPGDEILVTNGVYQAGARAVYGMSNRVAVTKPVTVRSVNGPAVTRIVGSQAPGTTNGPAAVRCVYLTNGAMLSGFTLTNGATQTSGDTDRNLSGGGVWCESVGVVVSNCVLSGNAADQNGGGAYMGTFYNCTFTANSAANGGGSYGGGLNQSLVTGNTASVDGGGVCLGTHNNSVLSGNRAGQYGGGAKSCTVNNCTLTANAAARGGGGCSATFRNCILYYNTAGSDETNWLWSTLTYCCTAPLPGGTGNTNVEPQLVSASHLSANSPCIGRGSASYTRDGDIDGEPWASSPSIGCDEYWSGSVTGALSVGILPSGTNVMAGVALDFQAIIGGRVSSSRWNFGDGVVVSNRPWASHAWAAPGDYVVELSAYNESLPAGIAAAVTVHVTPVVHHVALTSTNPVPPYTSWATAATNIQDAIDAASVGEEVLVADGVYQTGVRVVSEMSNRVAVTKPLTVRSLNGPTVTSIVGSSPMGDTAVRCVYLTNGAMLSGFTLTNGATKWDFNLATGAGGGVWCQSASAVVSNCVLTGNAARYGAGSYNGTLHRCALSGNVASDSGGGAYLSTFNNCTLTGNSASGYFGGGVLDGTLNNCTVVGNSALRGGGAEGGNLNNCIVYYNTATSDANYYGATLNYCCTTPSPGGTGNFQTPPLFMDTNGWSNLRLQDNSPCIDAGNNALAAGLTDLDGNARIFGGTVDIGAYEFQLDPFHSWLAQYGFPTDGSADYDDTDTDGHNNWQEWVAGTNPTNTLSVLRMLSATGSVSAVTVTWTSVSNRTYSLERATDLGAATPFSALRSNIAGFPDVTSWTDTNDVGSTPRFYRVRVVD